MSYSIDFSKQTAKVLKKWKKSNPIAFNKFKALLKSWNNIRKVAPGIPNRSSDETTSYGLAISREMTE